MNGLSFSSNVSVNANDDNPFLATLFGGCITDYWRGCRYSLNCNPNNKNITICQYVSLLLSDLLDNPFTNVTLDDIDKSLPLFGVSLLGDREQHHRSDSENDCTS